MARRLVRSLSFAALGAALFLEGCGNSVSLPPDRASSHPLAAHATEADSHAAGYAPYRTRVNVNASLTDSKVATPVSTLAEQSQAENVPAWLDELLHSPDPNVRIQALDAWARQPTASLDPVTYALVDPDGSVRARAQELLEQELARR